MGRQEFWRSICLCIERSKESSSNLQPLKRELF